MTLSHTHCHTYRGQTRSTCLLEKSHHCAHGTRVLFIVSSLLPAKGAQYYLEETQTTEIPAHTQSTATEKFTASLPSKHATPSDFPVHRLWWRYRVSYVIKIVIPAVTESTEDVCSSSAWIWLAPVNHVNNRMRNTTRVNSHWKPLQNKQEKSLCWNYLLFNWNPNRSAVFTGRNLHWNRKNLFYLSTATCDENLDRGKNLFHDPVCEKSVDFHDLLSDLELHEM